MGVTSGSSAHDHDGHVDAVVAQGDSLVPQVDPNNLPENVIPLRPIPGAAMSAVPATPRAAGSPMSAATDSASSADKPTPIFGRAALNLPEWPTVLVFTALAISVLVVVFDSFRRGALLFGASMALAFFFRLVLTDREAGMLKVRSRWVDLLILGMFAASIALLAFWVPVRS